MVAMIPVMVVALGLADQSLSAQQQPLFDRLNLAPAWKITKGDPSVVVGVIDNGFDFYHPDLLGQLSPGFYYPGGYHTEFYENVAHGTVVASLIVANGADRGGMSGLAPNCRVLTVSQGMIEHALMRLQARMRKENPNATMQDFQQEMGKHGPELKAFGERWARYQTEGAADAIRYLVDHGVKVINISGAMQRKLCPSAESWQKLEDAFRFAAEHDVVIVLSAGNSAERWEEYPGDPETMIVAGASTLADRRWEQESVLQGVKIKQGSCFGSRLTVMAPVENLVTCQPHEPRFGQLDDGPAGPVQMPFESAHQVVPIGATSCAAPIVSSLVALLFSVRPELDAQGAVELVKKGCDDLGSAGFDTDTGFGRVNFGKTLELAVREDH